MSNIKTLEELVENGIIEMSRGEVISKSDTRNTPGKYPIYSSSVQNEGLFARYGKFMFDEELVSWSVDGGGDVFYRPKHKFSITNVSGYIRVIRKDLLDTKYLALSMMGQKNKYSFDYSFKAHPSVIAPLYSVNLVDIEEQKRIAGILSNVDSTIKLAEDEYDQLNRLLEGLINNLIGEKELIPLSEYLSFTNGYSFKSSDLQKQGVPWVKISNVSFGRMNWDLEDYLPVDFLKKYEQFVLKKEDIVLALTRPIIDNKLKIAQIDKDFCLLNQRVAKVVVKNKDFKELILFLLQSSYCVRQIEELISGMDPPNVSTSQIEKILVPLFTSEEAKKITEVLSNLDCILMSKKAEISKLKYLRLGFLRGLI